MRVGEGANRISKSRVLLILFGLGTRVGSLGSGTNFWCIWDQILMDLGMCYGPTWGLGNRFGHFEFPRDALEVLEL